MAHVHGSEEMVKDIAKLGYREVILKSDGEPALKSVQEEVRRRREESTILENSPPRDSKANGAAERAVQSVGEQVRVLRSALQRRIGAVFKTNHPVIAWLVEYAADLLSKFLVGDDGKTAYERLKGKPFQKELAEFGERVHYKLQRCKGKEAKMEAKWGEGHFLGFWWRTGEAIIGTGDGIVKAATIRRVGAHRRWDAQSLHAVQGVPWKRDPKQEDGEFDVKIRWLTQDEKIGDVTLREEDLVKPRSMKLKIADFLKHGFTEGCPGCRSLIAGTSQRVHWDRCRARLEAAMQTTIEGREKKRKQTDRENEYMAEKMQRSCEQAVETSSGMQVEEGGSGTSQAASFASKREREGIDTDDGDIKRARDGCDASLGGDVCLDLVEKMEDEMQDDMAWEIGELNDMCEPDCKEMVQKITDFVYYDETTWEPLDSKLVREAEREEMERFRKMCVYRYVDRTMALNDLNGKFVKVKWVRINKGTRSAPKVRCGLVAQEIAYGEKMDELFAGTPSLAAVRVVLSLMLYNRANILMVLDVKRAFLYGNMRRTGYIELPEQDEQSGGNLVGVLDKAMYGTRDAPLIWLSVVRAKLEGIGFTVSLLQPSLYFHRGRGLIVVVHVDDFACVGLEANLDWLYRELSSEFEMTCSELGPRPEHSTEVKYLNRLVKLHNDGISIEGDPKHADLLIHEWGMGECKLVDTPMTKDLEDKLGNGIELNEKEGTLARRSIARLNYMAQDRPDLSAVSRALSSCMAKPHEGAVVGIKRVIRYIRRYPRCINMMRWQDEQLQVVTYVDSDWAGDVKSRKSTSGGFVQIGRHVVCHWSKLQSNIALSSGEAELNAPVKGISESLGVQAMLEEIEGTLPPMLLKTDASACRGMLLRHGVGRVKHLSTKQLWCQEAIVNYGIKVDKIPREVNAGDMLTHAITWADMEKFLNMMSYKRC